MHFTHRFDVHAPLADVVAFHRQSASMGAITPPPVIVTIHAAPPTLSQGDRMDFTLWLGPLPIRWLARIEAVTPTGFVDRQLRGPFARWEHRHTFTPVSESITTVVDDVHAALSDNLFWKAVGAGMWLNLRLLFAFRAWKTKRLLQRTPSTGAHPPSTAQTETP